MFWYHKDMEIILLIILSILVFDTILLMAIAVTISKLIERPEDGTAEETVKQPANIDLPIGVPTYDLTVFNGGTEPYTDGMDRRLTSTRNWDGISQQ